MPSITRRPRSADPSHGGRGTLPPLPFGGGGGGGGRGDGDHEDFAWKLRRYRLGLLFAVISISVLFVTLTSGFLVLRSGNRYDPFTGKYKSDWVPIPLPKELLLINTALLLASSLTLEHARRRAKIEAAVVPASQIPGIVPVPIRTVRWVHITGILGLGFLIGQWRAWQWLRAKEIFTTSGPSSTFVFLMTGTHAVHLLGGLLVLMYVCLARGPRRSLERRRVAVDVTALYWHFMSVLWIYVLSLLWIFGTTA